MPKITNKRSPRKIRKAHNKWLKSRKHVKREMMERIF